MYQQLTIVGRLGGDPEMRYLPDGTAVTNFSVATSEKWTDKTSGQKREKKAWFRVAVWGRMAEVCHEYLAKGRQVMVVGTLTADDNGGPRVWMSNNGEARASFEMNANSVKFLGDASSTSSGGQQQQQANVPGFATDDDGLPF